MNLRHLLAHNSETPAEVYVGDDGYVYVKHEDGTNTQLTALGAGAHTIKSDGAALTGRVNLDIEWLSVVDDPTASATVVGPKRRLPRATVTCVADSNINVNSAPSTIDGVVMTAAQKVWLRNQTNTSENGIWHRPKTGTVLERCTGLDDLIGGDGLYVWVQSGTTYGDKFYKHTDAATIELIDGPSFAWSEVDVDDFWYTSDTDWSSAVARAIEALEEGGTIWFRRRQTYDFTSRIVLWKGVHLRGTNVGNTLSSGTRLRFTDCGGIFCPFVINSLGLTAVVGNHRSISNVLMYYTGTYTSAVTDRHGIETQTPIVIDSCTVYGFPGDGVHCYGTAAASSATSISRISNVLSYGCGKWGFWFDGSDANASMIYICSATLDGQLEVDGVNAAGKLNITNNTGAAWPPADIPAQTLYARSDAMADYSGLFYRYRNSATIAAGTIANGASAQIDFEAHHTGVRWGRPVNGEINAFNTDATGSYTPEAGLTVTNDYTGGIGGTWLTTAGVDCDGGGYNDSSFLGNHFFACHAASSQGPAYKADNLNSGAVFFGCYSESPPSLAIEGTAFIVGGSGMAQDPSKGPLKGLYRNSSDTVKLSPAVLLTEGAQGAAVKLARYGTDIFMQLYTDGDTNGYRLEAVSSGSAADTFSFRHSGSSSLNALALTQPDHARGAGHAVHPRGVIVGSVRIFSGASPPTQSTSSDRISVGDLYYVSPLPSTGVDWEFLCTASADAGGGVYNLTWTALRTAP